MPSTLTVQCQGQRQFIFKPEKTALLVIDMQRDFLDPEGFCAIAGEDIAPLRAIIPSVAEVTSRARHRGLKIIHTREGYSPDGSDIHTMKAERASIGNEGPLGRFLIRGEAGHDFLPALYPEPGESVIDKPGFSAFYRTGLEELLRESGITRLVLTGVTTQCCVHSTLRSAVDRGFWCLTLADATAAFEPEVHDAALRLIKAEEDLFGWVATCDSFLDSLSTGAPLSGSS
jgi:nicotinamidase-related amidase